MTHKLLLRLRFSIAAISGSMSRRCLLIVGVSGCGEGRKANRLRDQEDDGSSAGSDEGWSAGLEDRSVSRGWGSLLASELGELKIELAELSGLISKDSVLFLDDGLDDEDGLSLGAVSTGHLVVHLGNGSAESVVSVLLVHVDDTGSSQVLEHDSVVLDGV